LLNRQNKSPSFLLKKPYSVDVGVESTASSKKYLQMIIVRIILRVKLPEGANFTGPGLVPPKQAVLDCLLGVLYFLSTKSKLFLFII